MHNNRSSTKTEMKMNAMQILQSIIRVENYYDNTVGDNRETGKGKVKEERRYPSATVYY